MTFSRILIDWFEENHRALPWRDTTDPYRIWVSEVILQQTRVVQGIRYYHDFLEHFPTVVQLARAKEDEVLKVWQGLGYYSRARNMHAAAQTVERDYNGIFPSRYEDIRQLKGVGDYTAAAVASIAFGLPYPAVDGNVLRFVARYAGIFENITTPATRRIVTEWCSAHIPADQPGAFNQAMMEMGATVCLPTNPTCDQCPFKNQCYAFQNHQVESLPIRLKKVNIRERYFHYLVFRSNHQTLLHQRKASDIWKGLFEFPLHETTEEQFDCADYLTKNNIVCSSSPLLLWKKKHILTHQHIYASFYLVDVDELSHFTGEEQIVSLNDLKSFAIPRVIEEFVNWCDLQEAVPQLFTSKR